VLLPRFSAQLEYAAPDGSDLGLFLPYTPLQHLLLGNHGLRALVMTSGNRSEEPIAIGNEEALDRLSELADFFLLHNRDILLRCDDSVVRRIAGKTSFARRSRGFVPAPILLGESVPAILAVGGELKNAICLSRDRLAFMGQHIGDMEELSAYNFFQESIRHFEDTLEVTPWIVAHDLHPAYLSTQWARRQPNVRLVGVQHHHAHIASCMAENHLTGPVIGVALDGTGYGTEGNAWGGEVLIADYKSFERAAHFAYVTMPGGAQAIREPWRMAIAYLWQTFGPQWRTHCPPALLSKVSEGSLRVMEQMLLNGHLSPRTSSCGRLFDAVAAIVCNRTEVTYEAQAAIALEACCGPRADDGGYPFAITESECLQMDARPLFAALTDDISHNVAAGIVSRRFHNGLVDVLTEVVDRVAGQSGLHKVCLSGGSFQNRILSEDLSASLSRQGFHVFTQSEVPCGDGGLSLGQLIVAAHHAEGE
jgi:hydrogenase maturation protein HypF